MLTMHNINLTNRRVVIREDFNVPLRDGQISNDQRIVAALPTIKQALTQQAAIILLSHLGRPEEGQFDSQYSLAPVASRLSDLLGQPVPLISDWQQGVEVASGQVVLLENVRFMVGEKANDPVLAKQLASLGDVFVMDAFATAHRAQASTCGIAEYISIACAGPLLAAELAALDRAIAVPQRPLVAIVGGSKVSTKLRLLRNLLTQVDQLVVGGGIANTLLAAKGLPIGKSLFEPDLIDEAKALLSLAEKHATNLPLPTDVIVAKEFSESAKAAKKSVGKVRADDMILDIGPATAHQLQAMLQTAGTILWNGPVGVFEWPRFAAGTKSVAHAIAKSNAYSIAGGGDTLAAIAEFGVSEHISYISTGGGAFLAYVEGSQLPAVSMLEKINESETATN